MNAKEKLCEILETFCGENVFLQGTFNPEEEYPADFITFFTTDTEDNAHYNNNTTAIDWTFTVIYYSDSPQKVASVPPQITQALKEAGFIPQGLGNDMPSDSITHTGWVMEFRYIEYLI